MYLGDYLVQKNVITTEQLVSALVEQIKSIPPIISILFDSNVLDNDSLITVIKTQVEEDKDIITVLRDKKLLPEEKLDEILTLQSKSKKPLGQVLVENKVVDANTFEQHFNAYVSEVAKENEEIDKEHPTEVSLESSDSSDNNAVSSAALDSLQDLIASGVIDASALSEFEDQAPVESEATVAKAPETATASTNVDADFYNTDSLNDGFVKNLNDTFSEELYHKLLEHVSSLKSSDERLKLLFNHLHLIKDCARLVKAKSLDNLISKVEDIINGIEKDNGKTGASYEQYFMGVVVYLWELRCVIVKENSEANFYTEENINKYKEFISKE